MNLLFIAFFIIKAINQGKHKELSFIENKDNGTYPYNDLNKLETINKINYLDRYLQYLKSPNISDKDKLERIKNDKLINDEELKWCIF